MDQRLNPEPQYRVTAPDESVDGGSTATNAAEMNRVVWQMALGVLDCRWADEVPRALANP